MKPKFIQFLLFFLGILLLFQLFNIGKKEKASDNLAVKSDIEISVPKDKLKVGDIVLIKVKNNLDADIELNDCMEKKLIISRYANGIWENLDTSQKIENCEKTPLKKKEERTVSFNKYNYELFSSLGKYKIELKSVIEGNEKAFTKEFNIVPPSLLLTLWNSIFYKPIYNTLILFIKVIPGHNLGIAVILLTTLIRAILFPFQEKALRSQKELQKLQPLLNQIKEKYKDNRQKQAEETMKIWKEHKINPFASCLPTLIQFPIMIALFFVIKEGMNIDTNLHLLYSFIKNGDIGINPMFLWLDLTKKNVFILPLIIGGLQFIQMKLSFTLKNKNVKESSSLDQTAVMNNVMTYMLPIMVAFFTASLPGAVGLYWGVTTLFGIGQQIIINAKHG